jgi:hypothetical protein
MRIDIGWLRDWQTLTAATVAFIAAIIAFQNTSRSLRHSERLETHRRNRKHAAIRAVLPLALAQISDYAERSARALDSLVEKCVDGSLPPEAASDDIIQELPSETLKTLSEFIEYSDTVNTSIIQETVSCIQIQDSRLRGLLDDNWNPLEPQLMLKTEIQGRIIDAASIYAGAAAIFEYGRRQRDQLPPTILWDAVRSALRNMRFYEDEYPELYAILDRREKATKSPFERPKNILASTP